jgi:alpha-tubulin suppressor-like RCC1 family protein
LRSGVSNVFSTLFSFAALKKDGSVVTWGRADQGGDSSNVASQLRSGVTQITSAYYGAFAALKSDGSVVSWGDPYAPSASKVDASPNRPFQPGGLMEFFQCVLTARRSKRMSVVG